MGDLKDDLHTYLKAARNALLWKAEGLSEYDVRRPMTPTGTNLLGLVKHVAAVADGYFGDTFDRPSGIEIPWFAEGAEPNADMWVTAEESRADILDLWNRVWAHADETIEALELDATGHVPWWPAERATITLHRVLCHMVYEVGRHAGQADIVRESIDGAVGLREGNDNLASVDESFWADYRERVEQAARSAR